MSAVAQKKIEVAEAPRVGPTNIKPKSIHSKETMQLGVDMAALSATRGAKGITDMELMGPGVLVRWKTNHGVAGAALIPYGNLKTIVVEDL